MTTKEIKNIPILLLLLLFSARPDKPPLSSLSLTTSFRCSRGATMGCQKSELDPRMDEIDGCSGRVPEVASEVVLWKSLG